MYCKNCGRKEGQSHKSDCDEGSDDTLVGAVIGGVKGGVGGAIVGGLLGGIGGGIIGGLLFDDDDDLF